MKDSRELFIGRRDEHREGSSERCLDHELTVWVLDNAFSDEVFEFFDDLFSWFHVVSRVAKKEPAHRHDELALAIRSSMSNNNYVAEVRSESQRASL